MFVSVLMTPNKKCHRPTLFHCIMETTDDGWNFHQLPPSRRKKMFRVVSLVHGKAKKTRPLQKHNGRITFSATTNQRFF
jgi:hypothetical protein